jgi:hypothetical protein
MEAEGEGEEEGAEGEEKRAKKEGRNVLKILPKKKSNFSSSLFSCLLSTG